MRDYTILRQHSPLPAAMPRFSQPGFLFNETDYLRQHTGPFCVVSALNQVTGQVDARCAFATQPDRAVSPPAAPFGSVEFVQTLPGAVLNRLIDALVGEARATGALRLVNYPHCYAPQQAHRLTEQLLRRGFRVVADNQNSYLPVTPEAFENVIQASERRRLQKCRRAGFRFAPWDCPDLDTVTEFLIRTRRQRGYELTISAERLRHLIQTFPDRFPIFGVWDGPTIAALTVAVRVRDDILYNFLPASDSGYQTYSPVVLLTDGLFGYCQQGSIRLLDLGVSLDGDRQPKPSLLRFKRNLGALESPKLTFEKVF